MIFFSFGELKKAIEEENGKEIVLLPSDLKNLYSKKLGDAGYLSIDHRKISTQELFFLLDQYEKEENRVFSDWILTDQLLFSFLRDDSIPKKGEVKKHEGHFLEEKYRLFISQFLFPKLEDAISHAINSEDSQMLIRLSELMLLLPNMDKVKIQKKLATYVDSIIERSKKNESEAKAKLLNLETVALLNCLGETHYAKKVAFLDQTKTLIKQEPELSQKVISALKQINLHETHKKEVDIFISKLFNSNTKRGAAFPHFLRTPLFYLGLLVLAILLYILIPKEVVKSNQTIGLPMNRTGLDSLSLDEVKSADSLLGFKGDSLISESQEYRSVPMADYYQMIDSDDTLKNDLVRALNISMIADYKIQKDQNNSKNCNPMSMGEKNKFQMEGVQGIENLKGGLSHRIENKSPYDLYILIFENDLGGGVFGSFVPSKGDINFEFLKGMRMIIYSGKDLTKFKPLQHQNGGYGSIVNAKRIDERFVAHFCSLDEYNLQLMSKSWWATKKGDKTVVSAINGPIQVTSDAFIE